MNARVTTFKISKAKWEPAMATIQSQVSARVSHNPAVKAGYWMADPDKGKLVVTIVFENEAAMHAAAHTAKQLRELALEFDATSESVDELEVIAAVEGHNFEA